ncbi:caspase family protein [Streptomyces sp. NBC_00878]|uniref:HD domain-containing protein n=1 Tax=Streptomyces sp. NBC_00878 TaxID=2975854 RepID=UPI002252A566|nr:caspase family protein [Streptomyces sp. NBC_00878]MCX4906583.1 caspase family protein [Streptomyces sp. NBC_00878]
MSRHRALLIGVAQYEAPGISALPFVPQDLERMAAALTARGFHQVRLARAPWFTPNVINGEVAGFLAGAEPGDRLLIVLSGHGVHSAGKDYLVPEDIRPELAAFTDGCVKIDWQDELESSPAAQIVFLIDACREGIQRDTMGDAMGTAAWTNRKVAATLRRKVAYVYACSKAQVARFVREKDTVRDGHDVGTEPGESFSLFSRTVTELLGGPAQVSSLREFRPVAQQRIDALHTAYGKPGAAQTIRVLTEDDHADFVLFPLLEQDEVARGTERTWTEAVAGHLAWKLTGETDVEALKDVCGRLAGRFARACAEAETVLAQDPWYDRELAERTTERVGFLLLRLAEGTRLSPTEAALLTVLPFAAQAHWARHAARRKLPEDELSTFLQAFPRLRRRLRTLGESEAEPNSGAGAKSESDPPSQAPSQPSSQLPSQPPSLSGTAVRDIRWWGVHRWLVQHPEAFTSDLVACDAADVPAGAGWIRTELSTARLLRYVKEQRIAPAAAPGTTRSTALGEERQVAPSTPHEHTVRERLVSALLKAAHAFAIDPADLPEVLVEHLGISDSVSLDALHATLRQSHWLASGTGRSLSALCEHPAVELALKRHAETVDTLLRDINKESAKKGSSLTPLNSLPAYADGQQVKASGATPAKLSTGIRFRLADDRVQELLMGEQLYGDRALAIRELYQNALDALRYRTARTEYLRRTGVHAPPWQGKVLFTEGTDEHGRPYLECADNGVGMGVTELSRAFSRGGSRFVDLPEYLEEGALWAALDPPVEMHPVSRFGLGVLSYFMIADELSVLTCRLDRTGRPGHLLKVTIAGPGNLFRVEDLGPGKEAGTAVRLIGAPGRNIPSSGEELGKCLWVSPYEVRAGKGEKARLWEPGKLVTDPNAPRRGQVYRAPEIDSRDPFGLSSDASPYTWYAEGNEQLFGSYRSFPSQERPSTAAPSGQYGLWWTDGRGSVLVDGIAIDTGLFGRVANLHGAGQATLSVDRKKIQWHDELLVRERSLTGIDDLLETPGIPSPSWLLSLHKDDPVLAEAIAVRAADKGVSWKTYDWTLDIGRTGFFPPDLLLLPAVTGTYPWPVSHHDAVAALLVLCMPEPVLRWRLRALHTDLPQEFVPAARPSDLDLLCAIGGPTNQEWARFVAEISESFARVRGGHQTPSLLVRSSLSNERDLNDASLLRKLFPWRPAQSPVSPEEAATATYGTQFTAGQIARRLVELGYDVAPLGALSALTADDLPLLLIRNVGDRVERRSWNSFDAGQARVRELAPEDLLPAYSCVHLAYLYVQRDPAKAARRLAELGYTLPDRFSDRLVSPSSLDIEDRRTIRALLGHPDAVAASSTQAATVTRGQLLYVSAQGGKEPQTVATRLAELGFTVPEADSLVVLTELHSWVASQWPVGRRRTVSAADVTRNRYRSPGASDNEIRSVLADFGYVVDDAAKDSPSREIPRYVRGGALSRQHLRAVANPTYLRVAAAIANGSAEELKSRLLTELGPEDIDIPSRLPDDPAHDQTLIRCFEKPETLTRLRRPNGKGQHIHLAEIASAAIMVRRPFWEVAAMATRIGFRHDAEDWFGSPT